jgi:organic radical activating enzyme
VGCKECHNPQLHDFNYGRLYEEVSASIQKEIEEVKKAGVKHIWVMGGEPLNQDSRSLHKLLTDLQYNGLQLWLFTSFQEYEVPDTIKEMVDVVKCGHYAPNLPTISYTARGTTVELASDNQYIVDTTHGRLSPNP